MKFSELKAISLVMALLFLIGSACSLACIAQADDGTVVPVQTRDGSRGFLPIKTVKDNQREVEGTIEKNKMIEADSSKINKVEKTEDSSVIYYNDKGLIDKVVAPDGTVVYYAYVMDENNKIKKIILTKGNQQFIIDERSFSRDSLSGHMAREESVEVCGDGNIDLNRIAQKGVDFDAIDKSFDDFYKKQKVAYETFYNATNDYYIALINELKKSGNLPENSGADLLKESTVEEGGSMSNDLSKDADKVLINEKKRRAIDEKAAYICFEPPKDEVGAKAQNFFKNAIKELQDKFDIAACIEIREKEIREAAEEFYNNIQSLPAGAVSRKTDKKIEVLIKIPDDDNKNDSENKNKKN